MMGLDSCLTCVYRFEAGSCIIRRITKLTNNDNTHAVGSLVRFYHQINRDGMIDLSTYRRNTAAFIWHNCYTIPASNLKHRIFNADAVRLIRDHYKESHGEE